ncbi:hypothetical protein hrd7_21520 [Leptolinea sp. HRD-7]|nr:hypothetical protein hrd7_21520 [Leptolinea sp. HRD-7]
MNIAATIYARKKVGLWPYDRRYLKGLLAGSTALLLGWASSQMYLTAWISFITVSFVVIFIFILCLFLIGFDQEDKILYQVFRKRLGF